MGDEASNSPRLYPNKAPGHPPPELSSSLSVSGLSILLALSGSEAKNSGGEPMIVKGRVKVIEVCSLPPEKGRSLFQGREY